MREIQINKQNDSVYQIQSPLKDTKNENKFDDEYGYLNSYKHSKLQSTDDDMMRKIIDYTLD